MLYKLRIRVVMQNPYFVIVLGVRLLESGACKQTEWRTYGAHRNRLDTGRSP